jgi:hypothetical protein
MEWGSPIVRDDLGQMLDFTLDSNVNLGFDYRTFDLLAVEEILVTLFCVVGKMPKQDSNQPQITETTNDEILSNEADFIKDMQGLMLQSCEDGTTRSVHENVLRRHPHYSMIRLI